MMDDTYWEEAQASYEQRRQMFLEFSGSQTREGRTGFFSQISRLALGREPVDEASIREGLAFVDSRKDCCDFAVGGLVRILYRFRDSPLISRDLIAEIEACLLRFKYWWDEPAGDNHRCYWTENHQIIFHSDELLAGQLFRDRVFQNSGRDGTYHIAHAEHLIRRWLDFRIRFGFSEWLSNCYFDEDLLALVNLCDFAESPDIQKQAEMLVDVILFEMALHSYRGVFGCTHGRSYPRLIKGARGENSASVSKMMLGVGLFNNPSNFGAVCLATSDYRCPAVIEQIASDLEPPLLLRERHSFDMDDAPEHGLSYDDMEDGHLFWSIQDYTHPKLMPLAQRIKSETGIMLYEDVYQARYDDLLQKQIEEHGEVVDGDLDCHAMTEVNIQTYRTADYMLSCAQDYRQGKPGYQQHIWQATLGIDAVVFTNHPGSDDQRSRPNYWAGNGILPRAAQHRNLLVCIHQVYADDPFPFSHAYFPGDAFDERIETDHWVCARKGDGYIGLFSQHAYRWLQEDGHDVEVRVDRPGNIWLCEMGRRTDWGDFSAFVQAVTTSRVDCEGLNISYASPSLGDVSFGWDDPLTVAGQEIPLRGYGRFDNTYCQCAFTDPRLVIKRNSDELHLDFEEHTRAIKS